MYVLVKKDKQRKINLNLKSLIGKILIGFSSTVLVVTIVITIAVVCVGIFLYFKGVL